MEIVALLVLIGLFYWVVKIPYEIIKITVNLCWILIWKIVYYIKYE